MEGARASWFTFDASCRLMRDRADEPKRI